MRGLCKMHQAIRLSHHLKSHGHIGVNDLKHCYIEVAGLKTFYVGGGSGPRSFFFTAARRALVLL